MADIIPVTVAVEGNADEVVARRLLAHAAIPCSRVHVLGGKESLMRQLLSFNRAAAHTPWLVLIDLDNPDTCAPAFIREHLPQPAQHMRFRVAVFEIEAWLLADRERMAKFLHISSTKIPREPDKENNPKQTLVNLARHSRSREIQADFVPRPGAGIRGSGYTERLIEFASRFWRPEIAAENSDSLRRCITALQRWKSDLSTLE